MPESNSPPAADIPEAIMLGRLAQFEQMREFFIQMWLQNPALAAQAGPAIEEILSAQRRPAGTDFCE